MQHFRKYGSCRPFFRLQSARLSTNVRHSNGGSNMRARIVIALVTILVSVGYTRAQSATLQYINWGFEVWKCDTVTFQVKIATGLDVYLVGIYGNATISAQGSADPLAGNSRVSLTSLTNPAI